MKMKAIVAAVSMMGALGASAADIVVMSTGNGRSKRGTR